MPHVPHRIEKCHSIADLRLLAQRRLPDPIFNYLDGGAEEELTLRRNTSAFDADRLLPNILIDVTTVRTATRVLGQNIAWPVFCAPAGSQRFYHEEGELAAARAADKAGTIYSVATMSSHSIEHIAQATPGPKMFQLFIFKDRGITRELIERCKHAGYKALCLTVDVTVRGKRERELRSGMGVPMKFTAASVASFAMRPLWLLGRLRKGPFCMPTFTERVGSNDIVAQTQFFGKQLDPAVQWKHVGEVIEQWGGPFAIKGILSVGDARRAIEVGASAVMLSNHGGRQLDHAAAPFEVLPAVADAVGGKIEIIVDGGIRRGVHVLKALARGATACSVGRPYLFGLGAGGEVGVARALDILRSELVRAMQLAGVTDSRSVDSQLLTRFEK
jgi:L-lactate dehydrogenase (cytochrome)